MAQNARIYSRNRQLEPQRERERALCKQTSELKINTRKHHTDLRPSIENKIKSGKFNCSEEWMLTY